MTPGKPVLGLPVFPPSLLAPRETENWDVLPSRASCPSRPLGPLDGGEGQGKAVPSLSFSTSSKTQFPKKGQ